MNPGKNGVTTKTPENILFGAGTIHRGLKYENGKWNFAESIVGATSGGSKLDIVPKYVDIAVDGVSVEVKGLTKKKVGETAQLEISWAELTPEIIKAALNAMENAENKIEGYTLLESKPDIDEGDYWDNIAFVGKTLKGKNVIAILDDALCTSGLGLEGKDGSQGTPSTTHICNAELTDDGDYDTLPYHIYYPNTA